jgi:hypothetical protein
MHKKNLGTYFGTEEYQTLKKMVKSENSENLTDMISALFNTSQIRRNGYMLEEIVNLLDAAYYGRHVVANRNIPYDDMFTLRFILRASVPGSYYKRGVEDDIGFGWGICEARDYWLSIIYQMKNHGN